MEQITVTKRIQLSAMMFLQYMLFAAWFTQLASYLDKIGVEGTMKALIVSSMAIGSLVSPIFCMFADRHFASQKVLMVLNIVCAILLFAAAKATTPILLFVLLLLAMFCYMPTWSLTSAIAMANCPSEQFAWIRVFGSIGWFASGIFSFVALKFFKTTIDATAIPLLCGAGTAVVAAILNLTLPNTPPPAKGKPASVVDALSLRALTMLGDMRFAFFMLICLLAMIPFTMYFSLGSQFFKAQGFEMVTATMNWGQFVEMFLMLLVPISLAKFGIKWTIAIGLGAQLVRFLAFWGGGQGYANLYFLSILLHGAIFGFLIVGGQVYVDKKAPAELKAQGQGLFGLMVFGIGMLIGNFVNVKLIDHFTTGADAAKIIDWNGIWIVQIVISVVLLAALLVFFKQNDTKPAAQKV
ncbi:MAG: nucleoside permease [Phycisphaerae bacterium]|nr:nucleoside permease [Phycisphaerae bacterium]